jgi:FkbM family methyltransferase
MLVNLSDNAAFKYLSDKESYERELMKLTLNLIAANEFSLFIDVGANYGPFSLAAAHSWRQTALRKVVAFEPDERPFAALTQSIAANHFEPVMTVVNSAVGDRTGEIDLFLSERSSASNRTFAVQNSDLRFKGTTQVPAVTLDQYFSDERWNDLSLVLKIDVEGNELRVLRGATKMLSQARRFVLIFEYYPLAMTESGLDSVDLERWLTHLQFDQAVCLREGEWDRCPDVPAVLVSMAATQARRDSTHQGASVNFVLTRGVQMPPDIVGSAVATSGLATQ